MHARIFAAAILFTGCAAEKNSPYGSVAGTMAGGAIRPEVMQPIRHLNGDFDTPPKFISGDAPVYPISRLQRRVSGYAEISCVIDEKGRTRDFRVIRTDYPYFASHAILAVQKWRFQPAMKHGRPVPYTLRIPFNYKIP
jgi:TonB family protein